MRRRIHSRSDIHNLFLEEMTEFIRKNQCVKEHSLLQSKKPNKEYLYFGQEKKEKA
jgi:hypothetical protein